MLYVFHSSNHHPHDRLEDRYVATANSIRQAQAIAKHDDGRKGYYYALDTDGKVIKL